MSVQIDGVLYTFSSRLPKNGDKSVQLILLKLLLGGISIKLSNVSVIQSLDHSIFPSQLQSLTSAKAVNNFLRGSLGLSAKAFVDRTVADNRRFFSDILAEFANYYICSAKGSHAGAFVYLYRALERFSFSVPLMYCSTSKDFEGTFNDLKKLFSKEGDGELGLLKRFIDQGKLIDPLVLSVTRAVDFSSSSSNGKRFYDLVTSRYDKFAVADSARLKVEIELRAVQGLFVVLRNRFFHFRSGDGQKNISAKDVHDADEFFSFVNPVFCNFLAVLITSTISAKYRD